MTVIFSPFLYAPFPFIAVYKLSVNGSYTTPTFDYPFITNASENTATGICLAYIAVPSTGSHTHT